VVTLVSELHQPGLSRYEDDIQKGRWGGRASVRGRRLRALYLGGDQNWFDCSLVVESTDGSKLEGPFRFHLHDSFSPSAVEVGKVHLDRYAMVERITAYETFTTAVEVKDYKGNWLSLELDLEMVPSIPPKYKPLSFRLQRANGSKRKTSRKAELERIIENNTYIRDPGEWRSAWAQAERWVCRIRAAARVLGSGVLVGPNVLLTNWHVVEDSSIDKLTFEFDYFYVAEDRPRPYVRRAAADGLLARGPYTSDEGAGRSGSTPRLQELDFALIALDRDNQDPLGAARGFAEVPAALTYRPKDSLIILQHPRGDPQCFALDFDGVLGLNENGTRLKYRTNTEPGSSGSPCFDLEWQFIAIHQAGMRGWPEGGDFNQGIPVTALNPHIQAAVSKWP
jgi:hypothetical protein